MKPISRILLEPYLTEKTTAQMLDEKTATYKYAFKVAMDANKHEVAEAIKARFGVEVDSVNTMVVRGKDRRVRQALGRRPNWKKALIKLMPGQKIAEFEGI